jgi:hypothetical protein
MNKIFKQLDAMDYHDALACWHDIFEHPKIVNLEPLNKYEVLVLDMIRDYIIERIREEHCRG